MEKIICRILYTAFAVCWSVNGKFVTRPNNLAVSVNSTAMFTCVCSTDSSDPLETEWKYGRDGFSVDIASWPSLTTSMCTVRGVHESIYHTQKADGVCNLIVNSTQLQHAGTYLCADKTLSVEEYSTAELVVIEPLTSSVDVMDDTAAESDTIKYTCNLMFSGSGEIIPSIRWTSGGDRITGDTTAPSANSPESVYTVNARRSNLPPCKCEVYFPSTSVSGPGGSTVVSAAQNTPTYNDSQSFAEIIVTYCPQNMMIPEVTGESNIPGGTVLSCLASGNPSPTIRWTNLTGDVNVTGSTFTVEANTFYVLTCTATNTITHSDRTRQTCSDSYTVTFNTTDVPTTTTPRLTSDAGSKKDDDLPLILGISLGIGIPVIICIFILLFCCCCPCCPLYRIYGKKDATDNSQPMSDINPRATTTSMTYEQLDDSRQRPVSYQQLPPQTGHDHEYYNVGSPANSNTDTPYEQLNINRQRSPVYAQLTIDN